MSKSKYMSRDEINSWVDIEGSVPYGESSFLITTAGQNPTPTERAEAVIVYFATKVDIWGEDAECFEIERIINEKPTRWCFIEGKNMDGDDSYLVISEAMDEFDEKWAVWAWNVEGE
jgi:hypothetical protein